MEGVGIIDISEEEKYERLIGKVDKGTEEVGTTY